MRRLTTTVVATFGAAALALAPAFASPAPARAAAARTPNTSAVATSPSPGPTAPRTYRNPVSASFADTYADPALVRGKDGAWYAYGTSDPLREGEKRPHRIPISRSTDLVTWTYVGDAFTSANLPAWAEADAGIWAPDIRYVDGQWRLYYVVTETTVTGERGDNAIGLATAPSPTGPWTDSGAPIVGPRRGRAPVGDFLWTFDPSAVTDERGDQWLFYGSHNGGIRAQRLKADGTTVTGSSTLVAIDNKFEGAYVVRRDGWYYLFASTANCCAGPTTGYSVQVGRSRSVTGPYVDREGVSLTASRAGGTPTLVQNGNRWIGAGHNAIATDVTGRDWMVYHAIDRGDPYLDGTDGINERPMLLDRLDWVDGWPVVNGGTGPSDGPRPAPVTRLGARSDRAGAGDSPTGGRRAEADVAGPGAPGVEITERGGRSLRAVVDTNRRQLRVEEWRRGRLLSRSSAPVPSGIDLSTLHSLVLETQGRRARAQLSHARLGDPFAAITLTTRAPMRPVGGRAVAGKGQVRNLSVAATPAPARAIRPGAPGRLDRAASTDFGGTELPGNLTWTRRDPAARVGGGALVWPTQEADLVGSGNTAGILGRPAPEGDWTVETKVTTDLGETDVKNFRQGGLYVGAGDDDFARLSHVAIWNTRQVEFGRELPYAGRLSYGGTIVGPPAETTWLRLKHRVDPVDGEREVQAYSSRDGRHWTAGGVWTFPAQASLRLGLVSHGGAGSTASFDYLRVYRP